MQQSINKYEAELREFHFFLGERKYLEEEEKQWIFVFYHYLWLEKLLKWMTSSQVRSQFVPFWWRQK